MNELDNEFNNLRNQVEITFSKYCEAIKERINNETPQTKDFEERRKLNWINTTNELASLQNLTFKISSW
jgi:hypothetical protein